MKDCMFSVAEEVCGKTKRRGTHREIWLWNVDVAKMTEKKRNLFKIWIESKKTKDKQKANGHKKAYEQAKREARRAVYEARKLAREKFCEQLLQEEKKGNVFRIVKQITEQNKDVVSGCNCVKDRQGKVVVDQNKVKDVWKDHFERLLNEEFDWDRGSLEEVREVSGPAEWISVQEVQAAITAMKVGKAAGPSGVVAEMLKASGEAGARWVTDLCNSIVTEEKIPDDWRKSWLISMYKGKGDAQDCGSYRGIKLLDQVMKVFERVMENRVKSIVNLDEMQFGFRAGKSTTDFYHSL